MNWFKSRSKKEAESTLMTALFVMMADGRVDDAELGLLGLICNRVGLEPAEVKALMANPEAWKFVPARDVRGRVLQLADAVIMMLIDGDINERELAICLDIGLALGFPPDAVQAMVAKLLTMVVEDIQPEEVAIELEPLVDN